MFCIVEKCNLIAVDIDQSKIILKPQLKLVVGIRFYVVNLFFSSVKNKIFQV